MRNILKTFSTAKQMFLMVWKFRFGKKYVFYKSIISLISSISPLLYTILPGLIINELMSSNITQKLILYVAVLILSPLFFTLLNSVIGQMSFRCTQQLQLRLLYDFEYHLVHMDYEVLENPDIQDLKTRAEDVIDSLTLIVEQLYAFIQSIIILIGIISIITSLNPFIIIVSILIVLFNSAITKRQEKKDYQITKEIQSKLRKQYGISSNLHSLEYAKDIRIFNAGTYLIEKVFAFKVDINNDALKMNRDGQKVNIIQSVTNVINELVLYVYAIIQVIHGSLSIGNMTIFLGAARQFSSTLSSITQAYIKLSSNTYKYDEYKKFISIPLHQYETEGKKPVIDDNSIIEFKDVWFKYPGTDRYILKNFNIKIYLNQKLCIVGANGVGKTTFIKLLTRLYTPNKGEILLNGINISKYNYDEYLSLFTAAFQDSKDFKLSIAENIALSADYSTDRLNRVCESIDLLPLISKLPKGYNTQVGKWIDADGIDFSGGELQKMTIARAEYHDSYVYLLDEPTAALDPLAEYEIYSQFNNMITDKCAILVSHRLSAVQLADKVAVFDNGSVAEYGTHQELYSKGGIYTEMFDKQAQFYRDEVNTDVWS